MKLLKAYFFIAAFLVQAAVFAQEDSTSIMLEVTGMELKKPSYLFGTIHLRCGEDYEVPKQVKKLIKNCSAFYTEIDPKDPLLGVAYRTYGKWDLRLDSVLGDSMYKAAALIFESVTKVSLSRFNQVHPFLTGSFYNSKTLVCDKPPKKLDRELEKIAQENKLDVYGLETADEHYRFIPQLPYKVYVRSLLFTIFKKDSANLNRRQLMKVYGDDDNELAKRAINKKSYSKIDSLMLLERNINWIPTMTWRMGNEATFFAFGYMHLFGEQGIVALLRKKGYTVTPIKL